MGSLTLFQWLHLTGSSCVELAHNVHNDAYVHNSYIVTLITKLNISHGYMNLSGFNLLFQCTWIN